MPRMPRNYLETSYFHVLVQGINKINIFDKDVDIKKYLQFLLRYKEEYCIEIIAYCIMNNHAHLLIKSGKVNLLSTFMHRVNTSYALYYNKEYKRVGYVFRDRFKSEGIYNEKYLYNCIRYIHNNPIKAGICKRAEDYEFSNYKEYIKNNYKIIEQEMDVNFIDVDDIDIRCKRVIENFLIAENMAKEDLKANKEKLKKLIQLLKEENKISYRKISKEIGIGRETLRKLLL